MSEEEREQARKRVLITLGLIAFLAVSTGINVYAISRIAILQYNLDMTYRFAQNLERKIQTIKEYAKLVNITVVFIPYESAKRIPPNVVTFLSGYAVITGLSEIPQRPIVVNVFFTLQYNTTGRGTVKFQHTPFQSVKIPVQALDRAEVPWGAFPVTVSGFDYGDQIIWTLTVHVQCVWEPVNMVVADQVYVQTFTFTVR